MKTDITNLTPEVHIDSKTGRPITRWSTIERSVRAPYFRCNPLLQDGRCLCFAYAAGSTAADGRGDLFLLDFKRQRLIQATDHTQVTQNGGAFMVAHRRNVAGFIRNGNEICVIDLDTLEEKRVSQLDPSWQWSGMSISADGKLILAEGYLTLAAMPNGLDPHARVKWMLDNIKQHKLLMADVATGKQTDLVTDDYHFLGHPQFSPTDDNLVLYCHQGRVPRHRIWLLNRKTGEHRKIRPEKEGETVCHEGWTADGKKVFYKVWEGAPDGTFTIALWDIAEDREVFSHTMPYRMMQTHINVSHDGTMVAGDGCDLNQALLFARIDGDRLEVQDLCASRTSYSPFEGTPNPCVHFVMDDSCVMFTECFQGRVDVCTVPVPGAKVDCA